MAIGNQPLAIEAARNTRSKSTVAGDGSIVIIHVVVIVVVPQIEVFILVIIEVIKIKVLFFLVKIVLFLVEFLKRDFIVLFEGLFLLQCIEVIVLEVIGIVDVVIVLKLVVVIRAVIFRQPVGDSGYQINFGLVHNKVRTGLQRSDH